MQISNQDILELSQIIANCIIDHLEKKSLGDIKKTNVGYNRTAYQRTEQLLYNYRNFKRIVDDRMEEIENIKRYGVQRKSGSIVEYTDHKGEVKQFLTDQESVDSAVHTVRESVKGTVQAISLIDECMDALKDDPYYAILEMRYFENRTQEDIALEFGCSQQTISNNKRRLVRELAVRLFPDQVVHEIMN